MPEAGIFDSILKQWPNGAIAVGLVGLCIVLFKYVATPFMDRMDKRTEARRMAAKEIREAEEASRQSELDCRVKIAEAQKETTLHLATLGADMKETVKMAAQMHAQCHARRDAGT